MFTKITVCLALVAGTLAHMMNQGHNWGNGNGNYMQNNWASMMQGGMNHQNGGFSPNLLSNLLGMGGMNNINGMGGMNSMNGMGGFGGMGQNHGMIGQFMRMLLMMSQVGNQHGGNRDDSRSDSSESDESHDVSEDDMKKLEEIMKMEFAKEVAHYVMAYQEYTQKMGAFKGSVEGLCLIIEAYVEHAKNTSMQENETLDTMTDDAIAAVGEIEDRDEKVAKIMMYLNTNGDVVDLAFFRFATMVCKSGEEYLEAYEKMEEWDKKGDCDKKRK